MLAGVAPAAALFAVLARVIPAAALFLFAIHTPAPAPAPAPAAPAPASTVPTTTVRGLRLQLRLRPQPLPRALFDHGTEVAELQTQLHHLRVITRYMTLVNDSVALTSAAMC